ncbi:aspartyl/asparaginyl beta-hydroxylase domain-containing protein [Sphingomonas sp. MMS24-J13]|uniref:aspartyl/asparaginyl beta-hydroxylase domain-containing protein n=1 Tax=Sphingomonas sp. MMS24-J13 TaxID=3238686 RepID=UPI00384E93E7
MPLTRAEADVFVRMGVAAMQRRAPAEALRIFDDLAARDPDGEPPWLLIAQAHRMMGDWTAESIALDRLLAIEPRNIRGLLMKGDCRAAAHDDRGATSFYQLALAAAAARPDMPPTLVPDLDRAEAWLTAQRTRYEEHLRATLDAQGVRPDAIGGRFRQSIEILTGRAQPFYQQPSAFFYPGLPQIQFYERSDFPWLPALEAETPSLRAELEAILASGSDGFAPYIEQQPDRPRSTNPLYGDPSWSALYLWRSGVEIPANASRAPRAMQALAAVPMPHIASRSPMALYSSLRPGAHIVPHNGLLNTRLICHLPLIAPPGCSFRVGNETRTWREGETIIFDDSIEHEARNDGTSIRIVLLFEIWRPELSAEERQALTMLYEAINLYTSQDAA